MCPEKRLPCVSLGEALNQKVLVSPVSLHSQGSDICVWLVAGGEAAPAVALSVLCDPGCRSIAMAGFSLSRPCT